MVKLIVLMCVGTFVLGCSSAKLNESKDVRNAMHEAYERAWARFGTEAASKGRSGDSSSGSTNGAKGVSPVAPVVTISLYTDRPQGSSSGANAGARGQTKSNKQAVSGAASSVTETPYEPTVELDPDFDANRNGSVENLVEVRPSLADKLSGLKKGEHNKTTSKFVADFVQPFAAGGFERRVQRRKVQLESYNFHAERGELLLTCVIRVLKRSYTKRSVIIRYTLDDWKTNAEVQASYVSGSNNGWSDKFSATIKVPAQAMVAGRSGKKIEFAILYFVDEKERYWDNNGRKNYSFRLVE